MISIGHDNNMLVTSYALVGDIDGGVKVPKINIPSIFFSEFEPKKFKLDIANNTIIYNHDFVKEVYVEPTPDSDLMKQLLASQAMVMALQNKQLEKKSKELDVVKRQMGAMAIVLAEVTSPTNEEETKNV